MEDDTTVGPPGQPPAPSRDRTVHGAVIGGACTIVAALIGYLGLPAVATPPTASVPTRTETVTTRVTVTATVTREPDRKGAATTPAVTSGGGEPTSLPSSEGWTPELSDSLTLEATWTNFDRFPPAQGSGTDVQVVGFVGGVYLKAWQAHTMAVVPAGAANPTPVACGDLVDASDPDTNHLTVSPGDRVCLRTDRARIVLLTLTATSPRGRDTSSAAADVVVWAGPDTPA
ncbi:MAG: hypothetical protein HOZ81_37675 [Streptomyces sp.]|nr:hypothetical protein [Streptomyces sp.]